MKKKEDQFLSKNQRLGKGEEFYLAWICYINSESGKLFSKQINEKKERLSGLSELTYRVINHWENKGLLTFSRSTEKGWRKYSIVDIIWIQIISELRNFGFPLEKILKVKQNLEMLELKNISNQFPFLEFLIALAIVRKTPAFLLVFSNGEVEPVTYGEYKGLIDLFGIDNHIIISINDILRNLYPEEDMTPKFEKSLELSEEEFDLLFTIRMENYEYIKIKLADNKIVTLEATENIDTEKRIGEILKENKFQDITIKKKNGKIVNINRTVKKRYE